MKKIIPFSFLLFNCFYPQTIALAAKPYNQLQVKQVNLNSYPKKINIPAAGVEITIGDLHGNALKLLNFLMNNDVMHLPKEDYKLFAKIYHKDPTELTNKDLIIIQAIINAANVNSQHKIRFLGDDLCDRGMNDYYTLAIYKKLDVSGVPFEVVLSNHGNFFLSAYEQTNPTFDYNPYGHGENEPTVQSMLHMGLLIDKGIVNKQDVLDVVQHHYLKHLVYPGYTYNKQKNELTIYSHAPIDLAILSALGHDLYIHYNDSNLNELTKSLDRINQKIGQWIINNTFTTHYNELNELHKQTNTPSPIKQVLWNRDYTILKRDHQPENKPYTVNYVHGHDSMPNVFNLDNLFGKGSSNDKGLYAIHITHS